jgi:glutathione synthase/RimK-type ligase-like ATP-grasp enzyme
MINSSESIQLLKGQRPVVGVLVNPGFFRKTKSNLFAAKLTQANEIAHCSIYFFSPGDIDWANQKISGSVLDAPEGKWRSGWLPFPDVLYDRFAGQKDKSIEKIRDRFHALPGIQFINSGKLEKWELHKRLSRYPHIRRYLPETVVYRQLKDIPSMLARYDSVYLKSSAGSGGRSVYCLARQGSGLIIRYYQKGVHHKRFTDNLNNLKSLLKSVIGKISDKIVVQQGIRLARYRGRCLDLRVLMVKDKNGIWRAVYNQARVAQKGAVITNLSLGGDVMNYGDIYPELKATYPRIPADEEIRGLCATIARHIEKEFGPFGEIGMDIAVDVSGKTWLLEANSKPCKLPEQVIEDTVGVSPQFLMTLQYARLLYARAQVSRYSSN